MTFEFICYRLVSEIQRLKIGLSGENGKEKFAKNITQKRIREYSNKPKSALCLRIGKFEAGKR